MTKKMIGALLVLGLAVTLGACGGGGTTTESPAATPAATPSP